MREDFHKATLLVYALLPHPLLTAPPQPALCLLPHPTLPSAYCPTPPCPAPTYCPTLPFRKKCWNCEVDHDLKNCTEPLNQAKIQARRMEFMQRTPTSDRLGVM